MRKAGRRETTTMTKEKKKKSSLHKVSQAQSLTNSNHKAEINSTQEKTAASDEDERISREGLCGAAIRRSALEMIPGIKQD